MLVGKPIAAAPRVAVAVAEPVQTSPASCKRRLGSSSSGMARRHRHRRRRCSGRYCGEHPPQFSARFRGAWVVPEERMQLSQKQWLSRKMTGGRGGVPEQEVVHTYQATNANEFANGEGRRSGGHPPQRFTIDVASCVEMFKASIRPSAQTTSDHVPSLLLLKCTESCGGMCSCLSKYRDVYIVLLLVFDEDPRAFVD